MTLFILSYFLFTFCTFVTINIILFNYDICVTKAKDIRKIVPKVERLWSCSRPSPTFCYKIFVPVSIFIAGIFNSNKRSVMPNYDKEYDLFIFFACRSNSAFNIISIPPHYL